MKARRIQRAYRRAVCRKLEDAPPSGAVSRKLGVAKMKLGRYAEGRIELEKALETCADSTGLVHSISPLVRIENTAKIPHLERIRNS